ncbi:hypothetical protein ES703_76513 [subsurface metagenome]
MWFIVALIVGGLVGALMFWLRGRDIKVTWYEWLIGIIGLLLLLFTIQNYIGSQAEWESTAANMFLLATGLPAIILIVVAGLLAWRQHRAA